LLSHPDQARAMGALGRTLVERRWSLDNMVNGYQRLIEEIYGRKAEMRR
jgi:hypothetical protein